MQHINTLSMEMHMGLLADLEADSGLHGRSLDLVLEVLQLIYPQGVIAKIFQDFTFFTYIFFTFFYIYYLF